MDKVNGTKYSQDYLNGVKETFTRMDNAGNGDSKVTVDEALKDLNIENLVSGQNFIDKTKILMASKDIENTLVEYAGDDGEFSAEEWADFINGEEWGKVLDAWHSSGKKAKREMRNIDFAQAKDGAVTKGEIKAGILNHLSANGIKIDTTELEATIDKYAGEDGTFTINEYKNLKKDVIYSGIVEKYNVVPWYKNNEQEQNNPQDFQQNIEDEVLAEIDKAGNNDGKVTKDELLKRLDIEDMVTGQNFIDKAKIIAASKDIESVLDKYAGEDGEFSANEYVDFINSEEWGKVLDAWHSSGKMAKHEMDWVDNAHSKDGSMTKGEIKAGILNSLKSNGATADTTEIEAIIDKYAGEDGTFTVNEYKNLKKDPIYKEFVEYFNVIPWYNPNEK